MGRFSARIVQIAAAANNGVIGHDDKLPWRVPSELQHFKRTTANSPLVMGRKTFESMPDSVWTDRKPFVLTREVETFQFKYPRVRCGSSLPDLLRVASEETKTRQVFIIGGATVFKLGYEYADELIISRFPFNCEGDTRLPIIPTTFTQHMTDHRNEDFVVLHYLRLP
jgi:dihydrofolate reductase